MIVVVKIKDKIYIAFKIKLNVFEVLKLYMMTK